MTNYKQKCLDIYYASDVCDKKIPKDLPLPVKYDGISYYWGKDGEMVADFDEGVNTGDGFRIRGWGRIQNEESQDECARWIEEAINSYSKPTLASWLRLMGEEYNVHLDGDTLEVTESVRLSCNCCGYEDEYRFTFNLTTQEPTDWEALYNIIK